MFIVFEGLDGSGKTTCTHNLKQFLQTKGKDIVLNSGEPVLQLVKEIMREKIEENEDVVLVREPGGHVLSEKIRELIMSNEMDVWTEIFLFSAARNELVQNMILPAILQGKIVICDRFTDSTMAYQGYGAGAAVVEYNQQVIDTINIMATSGLVPDITFYLDVEPEVGLARQVFKNNLDRKPLEFYQRVHAGYKELAKKRGNFITIDTNNQTPDEVLKQVLNHLYNHPKFRETKYFQTP
jgi:dTMP kinase